MSGIKISKLCTILPKSKRAKERVKQHGQEFLVQEEYFDRILVKSVDKTWNNKTEHWLGWFTSKEASWFFQVEKN